MWWVAKRVLKELIKRKRGEKTSSIKWLIAVPILMVFSLFIFFLHSDSFWFVYYWNLLRPENTMVEGGSASSGADPTSPDIDESSISGSTPTEADFSGSVNLMYINQMAEGYCKEYLTIIRDHCNWTHMNKNVTNRLGNEPSIAEVLGAISRESSLQSFKVGDTTFHVPNSSLKATSWRAGTDLTLSCFDSKAYNAHPNDVAFKWKGSYYGILQMSKNHFGVSPENLSGSSNSVLYPSRMSPDGTTSGTRQNKSQMDIAYLPDVISGYIQITQEMSNFIDVDTIEESAIYPAAYMAHNMGNTGFQQTVGVGGRPSTASYWITSGTGKLYFGYKTPGTQTGTIKEAASSGVNNVYKSASNLLEVFIANDIDMADFPEMDSWTGVAVMDMTYSLGGFVGTSTQVEQVRRRLKAPAFVAGATATYRALTGNVNATKEEAIQFLQSKLSTTKTPDPSIYGSFFIGKDTADLLRTQPVINVYNSGFTVTNSDGKSGPALQSLYSEAIGGFYQCIIRGLFIYHDMLLASGVEVTVQELMSDSSGALIPTGDSGDSYYEGQNKLSNPSDDFSRLVPNSSVYFRTLSSGQRAHEGEDFAMSGHTKIYAMADGVVASSHHEASGGNVIKVKVNDTTAPGGLYYVYMHLEQRLVKNGDTVKEGDLIAYSGNTGAAGTYHLHIESRLSLPDGREMIMPTWGVWRKDFTYSQAPRLLETTAKSESAVYKPDNETLYSDNFHTESRYPKGVSSYPGTLEAYKKYGLSSFFYNP